MIVGYFLSLGGNGSRDKWSAREHRGPGVCQTTGRYKDVTVIDRSLLYEIINEVSKMGINMVVLDVLDAMQYKSHPEISLVDAFTHEEMRALLAYMRERGIDPVPKLNFSACHDVWLKEYSWMKGTAKYYEVVKDLIDEVCEVFDRPTLFHLGMDEEDLATHKKGMTIIRCNALWFHDLNFYMDCVQKNGVRPWIWGDFYWKHPEDFAKNVSKECLISNWGYMRYAEGHDRVKMQYDSYIALDRLGYDQLPCGSGWCCHQNVAQIVHFFKKHGLVNDRLKGFMVAPWTGVSECNKYDLLDNAHRISKAMEMLKTE